MSENRDALMQEAVRRGLVKDQATAPDPMRAEAQRRGLIPSAETYGPPVPPPQGPQLPSTLRQAWPSAPPESFAGEAQSALRQGGRELWRGAENLLGNFFKSLLPVSGETSTRAGRARAGGDVVRQLSDIGTFASGGLTSPIQIPQQAAGLSRGLNIAPPRQAEVPRPQLALPPPARIPTPGTPPISTGEGIIPRRQPGTMTSPMATPGGVGGPLPRPPEPPPAAAPSATAPPRAPRTAIDDAHIGHPSSIASAFVTNDASAIDQTVTKRFRQAVPGRPREQTPAQMETRDQHITTAVDSIILNKDNIQFRDPRDPTGQTLQKAGRLPRNIDEFVQSVDYLKGEIFKKYDMLATRLGLRGVRVDLGPTIARLRQLATDPAIEDITPAIRREAMEMAERFERRGSYSPQEAQNVVQSMNAQLRNFLQKKPTGEIFSHPTLINNVRDQLLGDLNSTMERALGDPRYQALRYQYASLASIEGNLTNALVKQLEKPAGLLGGKKLTLAEMGGLIWGAVDLAHFGSPKVLGVTAATHFGRELQRFLTSENFAVRRMFSAREPIIAPRPPILSERLSARAGRALSEAGQRQYEFRAPYVGPSGM